MSAGLRCTQDYSGSIIMDMDDYVHILSSVVACHVGISPSSDTTRCQEPLEEHGYILKVV